MLGPLFAGLARSHLVRQEGFEPPTCGLEGRRSIHLSYWRSRLIDFGRGERIRTSDFLLPKQARYQTAPRPAKPAIIGPFSTTVNAPDWRYCFSAAIALPRWLTSFFSPGASSAVVFPSGG